MEINENRLYERKKNEDDSVKNQLALNLLSQADEMDVITFVKDYLTIDKIFRDAFIADFK